MFFIGTQNKNNFSNAITDSIFKLYKSILKGGPVWKSILQIAFLWIKQYTIVVCKFWVWKWIEGSKWDKQDNSLEGNETSGPHPNDYQQKPAKPGEGGELTDFTVKNNPSHKSWKERRDIMAEVTKSQKKEEIALTSQKNFTKNIHENSPKYCPWKFSQKEEF